MSAAQPGSAHAELVDDETPDKTPGTTNPDAEVVAFAKAIHKIVKQITPAPNPNSGNTTHLMVPTLENSALLSSSANSTSEIIQIYFWTIQLRAIICCPI